MIRSNWGLEGFRVFGFRVYGFLGSGLICLEINRVGEGLGLWGFRV